MTSRELMCDATLRHAHGVTRCWLHADHEGKHVRLVLRGRRSGGTVLDRAPRGVDTVISDPDELDHTAHVLDDDGVTETRFVRTSPTEWTNAEEITIPPGGVLQFAPGMFIANPAEPIEFETGLLDLDL